MKFSPFSKLPEEGLKWLLVAYNYKADGWTDKNYKDCYLAFCKALPKGEFVTGDKFDALVRFWGDQKRTKTFDLARDPYSRYRMVPNKMLNTYQTRMGGSTKKRKASLLNKALSQKPIPRTFLRLCATPAKQ